LHDGTTPRKSYGCLFMILRFLLRIILKVPGQVIALNSATPHASKC